MDVITGINAAAAAAVRSPIPFERLSLRLNWCAAEEREYELKYEGGKLICSEYFGFWQADEEREKCLENRLTLGEDKYNEICRRIGELGVREWYERSWDNPNVLDGESFRFSITEGGKRYEADGTNAWPKGYREFCTMLTEIFKQA